MKKTQRLDKVLANTGYGTRSEMKQLLKKGAVSVNGNTAKDGGLQVDPYTDILVVNGETVLFREYVYIMLNKPQGVVSATEDNRDKTVVDLLSPAYRRYDIFPVGRLDKDTEGLLLLTNDGKLAHNLLSPRKHVPKTYFAKVAEAVGVEEVRQFSRGVELDDGYTTLPAELEVLMRSDTDTETGGFGSLSEILLTIHEGKFHQVKRMFEAVGKKVVYLKRLSMGPLRLDEGLAPGAYRELTAEEEEGLKKAHEL